MTVNEGFACSPCRSLTVGSVRSAIEIHLMRPPQQGRCCSPTIHPFIDFYLFSSTWLEADSSPVLSGKGPRLATSHDSSLPTRVESERLLTAESSTHQTTLEGWLHQGPSATVSSLVPNTLTGHEEDGRYYLDDEAEMSGGEQDELDDDDDEKESKHV